jgi:hypothetical protein
MIADGAPRSARAGSILVDWAQAGCGSVLFVFGTVCLLYGTRALTGRTPTPWSHFLPKKPVTAPPASAQESVIAGTLGIIVGSISVLGAIGLLVVSLL